MNAPRLLIAAPSSGSGKTTVTVGIMAALSENREVQGFKVGPDYIDPNYHSIATGRISRNLDTWMLSKNNVAGIFSRGQKGADISIIEGVMGLFDGIDGKSERGSSAEVAKLLKVPVVLVIDVRSMARSAAAIALGFKNFDPDLILGGVIANRVGSLKHAQMVTEAFENIGLKVLGCIPRDASLNVPERHLGLYTAGERSQATEKFIANAKRSVQQHIDLEQLMEIADNTPQITHSYPPIIKSEKKNIRIAIARDEAFSFYYQDNFDLLEAAGAEIVFFSPLRDEKLPEDISGLYLGGGYPELYASQLSDNSKLLTSIVKMIHLGLPTYAECGGLMTLTSHFLDADGKKHPMLAVLPGYTQLTNKLKMGYREVSSLGETLLLDEDDFARGHEFHYSEWINEKDSEHLAYKIKSRDGKNENLTGFTKGNLLASYIHLHFGSNPEIATTFVDKCEAWQNTRNTE